MKVASVRRNSGSTMGGLQSGLKNLWAGRVALSELLYRRQSLEAPSHLLGYTSPPLLK
jgi:hypothetical protein